MPDFKNLADFPHKPSSSIGHVYMQTSSSKSEKGLEFLISMLDYDPEKRISADMGLVHEYFNQEPNPGQK